MEKAVEYPVYTKVPLPKQMGSFTSALRQIGTLKLSLDNSYKVQRSDAGKPLELKRSDDADGERIRYQKAEVLKFKVGIRPDGRYLEADELTASLLATEADFKS